MSRGITEEQVEIVPTLKSFEEFREFCYFLKQNRVLSDNTRKVIQSSIDKLKSAIDKLEEFLRTVEEEEKGE